MHKSIHKVEKMKRMCYNTRCKNSEYKKGGQTNVGNSNSHIDSFVRLLDFFSDFFKNF